MAFNKPTFGTGTGFGQQSTFGMSGFGQTNTFGTSFGTNQTQQPPPSLFGGQAQQPQSTGFGVQPQQQTGTGFGTSGGGLFGSSAPTNTFGAPSTNAFGTQQQTSGNLFGSKPTGTTFGTTNTGFSFGGSNTATTSAQGFGGFSGFNQTTAPTATPQLNLFSGFGQQPTQTSNSATNFNFGKPTSSFGTTSGFGAPGATGFSGFGQPQQQLGFPQQQQQQPSESDLLLSSIYHVNIYGDERDIILRKFNLLMAFAGVGKGYFNNSQQPIEYTPNNELCKFKGVVYNCKPNATHKDSLVFLNINKKYEQVQKEESVLINNLNTIFGNRPNIYIVIHSITHIDSDKTRVIFYINEKQSNGIVKKIVNTEIVNFMLQPMIKQQLTNYGVFDVNVYQYLDEDTLTQYLDQPPCGVNAVLWKTAQRDNPDPDKFIPVPIVGFEGIRQRILLQEEEIKLQQSFLSNVTDRITNLQTESTKANSKIIQYKQTILNIHNRLLKIIIKQEITRNTGLALTKNEEIMKNNFENIYSIINNNKYNIKSKISEMLSKIKLQQNNFNCNSNNIDNENYVVEPNTLEDIKIVFDVEQRAISTLVNLSNKQNKTLNIIKQGLNEILNKEC